MSTGLDEDKITVSKKHQPSDFTSLLGGLCSGINFKMIVMLFLIYILLHNDVFISRVLSQIDGTVGELGTCPTTKGTIILGTFLVIAFVLIEGLNKANLI